MITRIFLAIHYYRKWGSPWRIAWSLARHEHALFNKINRTRKTH